MSNLWQEKKADLYFKKEESDINFLNHHKLSYFLKFRTRSKSVGCE